MRVVDCDEAYGPAILAILNDAILTSTALYDYVPRPPEAMAGWFEAKRRGGFPVIGLVDADGTLAGFASYGTFRAFPAYKYTVEHSLYVARPYRGRGLAKLLLTRLIERAETGGVHAMVGAIDSGNAVSIALHRRFGFVHVGTLPEVGFKFGRWLDLCFYQRTLATPAAPKDG